MTNKLDPKEEARIRRVLKDGMFHLMTLAAASEMYHKALKEATEQGMHEIPGAMQAYRTISGNQSLDDLYEAWESQTQKSLAFLDAFEASLRTTVPVGNEG